MAPKDPEPGVGPGRVDRAGPDAIVRPLAPGPLWRNRQTRQTQNLLSLRTWEFESPRGHQDKRGIPRIS